MTYSYFVVWGTTVKPLCVHREWFLLSYLLFAPSVIAVFTHSLIAIFAHSVTAFSSRSVPDPRKADSDIACRAHAVPLPLRAAKGLEYVFPIWFTQCSRVWFTLAVSCPCHAPMMPFFSRPRHSTSVERRPLGYLPAASASSGYHAEFHEGCYQKHTNVRCRWPVWNQTTFVMDEEKCGSRTLQKRWSVKLLDKQFGYFRIPCGLSRRTRHYRRMAGARHGMCELTARHDRGTEWERNGRGMGTAWYVWIDL